MSAETLADALAVLAQHIAAQVVAQLAPELARQQAPQAERRNVLTVGEAAEVLGVHDRTVRRMIRDGRLSATRTGNSGSARVLISRADLDELIGGAR